RRAEPVPEHAEQHADAGNTEAVVPADALAQVAGEQWCRERTDVDAHVEDREAGVATGATLRIQVADDGGDVRLQQSGTDDNEDEADEEHVLREYRRQRDRYVTCRDEQ